MVDAACIPLRCATGEVKTYTQTHAGAVEEFLLMQKKCDIPAKTWSSAVAALFHWACHSSSRLFVKHQSPCDSVPASDFLMPAFSWIGGLDLAWKRSKYADEISWQRVCNAHIYGLCDTMDGYQMACVCTTQNNLLSGMLRSCWVVNNKAGQAEAEGRV